MSISKPWDAFLTERDKQHLAIVGPRARVGWREHPAVLLLDNYGAVLGEHNEPLLDQIKHLRIGTGEEGWAAIARIAEVVAAARDAGIPVVHVTGLVADGLAGFVDALRGSRADLATESRAYQTGDELMPGRGEVVFGKVSPSGFFGAPLAGHLQHLPVDTPVVCGETTSGCVRAIVVGACSYRFRVIPEECTYDRYQECHAINRSDVPRDQPLLHRSEVRGHRPGDRRARPLRGGDRRWYRACSRTSLRSRQ